MGYVWVDLKTRKEGGHRRRDILVEGQRTCQRDKATPNRVGIRIGLKRVNLSHMRSSGQVTHVNVS